MSTLILQGSLAELPDGSVARTYDVRVPCVVPPSERIVTLSSDSAFPVSLDGATEISVIYVEADFPVTVVLTSAAGTAQNAPAELLHLVSREVPITAISLIRAAGQATTVRLILGQGA
jgi:hypothetical protein